jgi:uncharacterized iron-regulated protein
MREWRYPSAILDIGTRQSNTGITYVSEQFSKSVQAIVLTPGGEVTSFRRRVESNQHERQQKSLAAAHLKQE